MPGKKQVVAIWIAALCAFAVACGPDEDNTQQGEENKASNQEPSDNAKDNSNMAPGNMAPNNNTMPGNMMPNNTAKNNVTPGNQEPNNTTPNNTAPNNMNEGFALVSSTPADGAAGIGTMTSVVLTFSATLAPVDGVEVSVSPDRAVSVAAGDDGVSIVISPDEPWAWETAYTLELSGVAGDDGQQLADEVTISFTTMAEPMMQESGLYESDGEQVTVAVTGDDSSKGYTIRTTAELRDNDPASKEVVIGELPGQPVVRTGSLVFDALFAMSVEEARQCSVSTIQDGAFNNGNGVDCECFETGAKWRYVWTRDTAYAVDLGLAILDPSRARRSMEFKLSELKAGGGAQIIQDTGSGGSWPVSTDRVVWAIGAWELLKYLDGAEREAFASKTYEAIVNTIEQDRRVVFDARDGLYRGEQSFLDWREQSYPSWTAADTVHLAMSKTLSTNIGHLAVLRVGAWLAAERGDMEAASRYESWAGELVTALNDEMWLEDAGMFSAMKTTELDQAPLHKYDLLGESLAVLWGAADARRGAKVVASYPHVSKGPPVLWPQQPLTPIYHNRGIWPFVTAYGLLAAREVGNAVVFEHDLESLIRGAALNLSNMENFEFTTQKPWLDDGQYSGPVVNSRRQLWSVAGYFGAVVKGVFGMEASVDSVRFAPFITPAMHARWFDETDRLELRDIVWRGRTFDVQIVLPEAPADPGAGPYEVSSVTLGGQPVDAADWWGAGMLGDANEVVIEMSAPTAPRGEMALVEDLSDFRALWSPRDPNLSSVELLNNRLTLTFDSAGESDVVFDIFRDGERIAQDVSGPTFEDPSSGDWAERSHCYAVEAKFTSSGNRSHHSKPVCFWGQQGERVQEVSVYGLEQVAGGDWSTMHGRAHLENWGDPGHELAVAFLAPERSGTHLLQLVYGNGSGGHNTGITASVKEVILEDAMSGAEVSRSYFVMPQLADWARWGESSFVEVELDATKLYRVRLVDAINMSYFEHFRPYTGGTGGGDSTFNRANISALKVLSRAGGADTPAATIALDGVDDLGKFAQDQRVAPGAAQTMWSQWAIDWDERYVYVTLVAQAFEAEYKPVMLYVEAARGALGAAVASDGVEYSGQTAKLPFTPNYLITGRRLSFDGNAAGPWNGVMRQDAGVWVTQQRFSPDEQWWMASDNHTISFQIDRAALGDPDNIRIAGHVVNAVAGNEWAETLPSTHTPWQSGATGYLEIDLSGAHPASGWGQH